MIAATTPPQAAILVFTTTIEIATASSALPKANWDPPLIQTNQNHRMNVPKQANGILAPAIGEILPSLEYLPARGPRIKQPTRAAQPPQSERS